MLIIVSAVCSAVALIGALIVGYSTQKTVHSFVPKRDPNAVLTAFPADIEQEIKQQTMVSTGVAITQPAEPPSPDQLAETLRNSIARASTSIDPKQQKPNTGVDTTGLATRLEGLLLDDSNTDPQNIAALRDYALRELTNQDGSVSLPNYDVSDLDLDNLGLSGDIAQQISGLQSKLNEQIAALPQLQGRQIDLKNIQLGADPQQLAAAIDSLGMESDMLGLNLDADAKYDSLKQLGEQLLTKSDGKQVSLDGLDMSELESISRDLLNQLNAQGQQAVDDKDDQAK